MQHPNYPDDVSVLHQQGREFILIGTAHVSRESADLVRQVITREQPDCVCVELDGQRFTALSQQQRWENLDLREIIRQRQLGPLLVNLVLASYQKKLGGQLGLMPGAEMLEAIRVAQEQQIPIALCDRDVRITLRRAWRLTPWYKKTWLLSVLLASLFDRTQISEEVLRDMRQQDVLSALIHEIGDTLPSLRQVILDERDVYLAQKIRDTQGKRVVVVIGAAHVQGVQRALRTEQPAPLAALLHVPPGSAVWRWLGWGIPATLIAALLGIGWQKGAAAFGQSMLYWTLASGLPSALGALCALAHPMTIMAAFVSAPITALSPAIGVGQVTALVQAYLRPPRVRELQSVAEDLRSVKQWWQNRLLRIFLAFLLPSLGTMLGVWFGGYKILSTLF
ncbi:MAG: TraB/GumN family protein [Candidatus Tectimicrobiota bacterium]